ncbi:DUF6660 family protein [Chitinophaga qingshengii]|uniref:DUF2946 domain-containing protein n=1 Tax=Chitinophaga qingshengii TaxID=1569794 RepID=A0ABR7TS99_9BACT|nr:DUF6660 family protein [Chitinophaga qingshengii]MBC9933367.1 hypothetical protein [Chitinophaga qingshengii]
MKWLIYLLSVYILVLSCIPCDDARAAVYQSAEVTAAGEHHHEAADFCSPLCICSCCNVQVTPATVIHFPYIHHQVLIEFPVLREAQLPLLYTTIWQPPRL